MKEESKKRVNETFTGCFTEKSVLLIYELSKDHHALGS